MITNGGKGVNEMIDYDYYYSDHEAALDAYDREPYDGEAERAMDEGKREQQPDGSFMWVD